MKNSTQATTQDLQRIKFDLIHVATRHDAKEAKKAHHNKWALSQYFARIDDICADIEKGANVRDAVIAAFTGRLLRNCLKQLNLPELKDGEHTKRAWFYVPASKK